jgi:hypothetical protein
MFRRRRCDQRDAWAPLLRQVDRTLGLLKSVAECLKNRGPGRCTHSGLHLLRQRVYYRVCEATDEPCMGTGKAVLPWVL